MNNFPAKNFPLLLRFLVTAANNGRRFLRKFSHVLRRFLASVASSDLRGKIYRFAMLLAA
jgi:hypothetical protein